MADDELNTDDDFSTDSLVMPGSALDIATSDPIEVQPLAADPNFEDTSPIDLSGLDAFSPPEEIDINPVLLADPDVSPPTLDPLNNYDPLQLSADPFDAVEDLGFSDPFSDEYEVDAYDATGLSGIGMTQSEYEDAISGYYDDKMKQVEQATGAPVKSLLGNTGKEDQEEYDARLKWRNEALPIYQDRNKEQARLDKLNGKLDAEPLYTDADLKIMENAFINNRMANAAGTFSLNPNTWSENTIKMVIAFGGLALQAEMNRQAEKRMAKMRKEAKQDELDYLDASLAIRQKYKGGGGGSGDGGGGASRGGGNAFGK